jgi:hypothetical protein
MRQKPRFYAQHTKTHVEASLRPERRRIVVLHSTAGSDVLGGQTDRHRAGDSEETGSGRIIAAILMLAGIGTIGMITGSIATYFLSPRGTRNPHVRHVQNQLGRWEKMTADERRQLGRILMALAHDAGPDKDARSVPFASDAQD